MLLFLLCLYVGDVFDVLGHKAELGEVRSGLHEYCLCQLKTAQDCGENKSEGLWKLLVHI